MNSILPLLFFVLQLVIFLLAIWYTAARFRYHFQRKRLWLLIFGIGGLLIGSLALIIFSIKTSSVIVGTLSNLGGYILISFVNMLVLLLLFQGIELFWKMPPNVGGILALILSLLITVTGALNANDFVVNSAEISFAK